MLKQVNGNPLRTGLQVASVYSVNNGLLDHVPVAEVVAWEKAMHAHLESNEKELLISIEKDWSDDIEKKLKDTLTSFGKQYGKSE
jgi:F-type H+-transporting ATPase subunit alpha